ncbi:hypothetical protein NUW54_g13849 [Trametes sanguinea]|uniref:Uncharacterized protein n=1 Tax=Trametes sanguinea TaxID=158606 RepID=A0ACC1MH80_9APHY|nr:hypothetical protein NUW54_g13849 [Trametes sanguinea]
MRMRSSCWNADVVSTEDAGASELAPCATYMHQEEIAAGLRHDGGLPVQVADEVARSYCVCMNAVRLSKACIEEERAPSLGAEQQTSVPIGKRDCPEMHGAGLGAAAVIGPAQLSVSGRKSGRDAFDVCEAALPAKASGRQPRRGGARERGPARIDAARSTGSISSSHGHLPERIRENMATKPRNAKRMTEARRVPFTLVNAETLRAPAGASLATAPRPLAAHGTMEDGQQTLTVVEWRANAS